MFLFDPPALDATVLAPIVLLAITGLVALLIELFSPKRNNNLIVGSSIAGILVALASVFFGAQTARVDTGANMIVRDALSSGLQVVILLGTLFVILFSEPYLRARRIPFAEFYPLALWSATGAMLMVSTTNLLVVFLGLEIMSIAIYVMAGMNRGEAKSGESALKYFLLGSFASGFLLYGIAMVYGATGGLSIDAVNAVWPKASGTSKSLLLLGLGLMLIGFSFKSSFVPFHQWTPDVYQGAPTNVTAFMATISKVGALGALWRIFDAYSLSANLWVPVVAVVAALTMVVGNVAALAQTDVKRMLGYSSVAQAGYALVTIVARAKAPTAISEQTLIFFLLSYVLTTVGMFAIVGLNIRNGQEKNQLDDFRGLARRSPLMAGALAFFALSLIGLPPLGGFFAKFYILADGMAAKLTWLAVVLALTSALSVIYYLRIVRAPFVDGEETEAAPRAVANSIKVGVVLCAASVLAVAMFAQPMFTALGMGTPPARPIAQR